MWVSAKLGTFTVVSVKGTPIEDQLRSFKGECAHFSFNKCPIYIHDGASAKFSTNSQKRDYSVWATQYRGGIFSPFMQMYWTWGSLTWALASGYPLLFCFILLYVSHSHHRSLAAIGRKKASSNSLVITKNNTLLEQREELRSDHTYIGTIEVTNRTSGQSQIKLRLWRSISLQILPLFTSDTVYAWQCHDYEFYDVYVGQNAANIWSK